MTTVRRRTIRSLLVGAVALVAAVGVAPGVAAAPTTVVPGAGPIDYVALGDSYSAGPLVPVQRPDPLGCLRSTNNYPAFLAGYLGVRSYVDVTCSGAESADLDRRSQETILPGPSPAPQLDALTGETDLVTLGIGGNDYALFGSMIEVCGKVAELDPKGAPCKRHFTSRGVDTKLRDATRIEKRVARVLRAVATRAPAAQVYVVGYPRLLPQRGTCDTVGFAAGDYRWGNRIEKRLNRSLRRAAAATGATYVNLYPASRGHDACAGNEAWINGKTLKPLRAANFHPFLRGMRGMAQEAYRQLTGGLTAPGHSVAQPPPSAIIG
jgi:lysophospholipase L1-like esterase